MRINTNEWASLSHVASHVDIDRRTLWSAAQRGEVRQVEFQCGTKLVNIQSAERYAEARAEDQTPQEKGE